MKKIIPQKLKKGDEIRIIAPSRNMRILNEDLIQTAMNRLEDLGFKVTLGKNVCNEIDSNYSCASIEDRVKDIHDAFRDKNVKGILTVIGGYNANQILDYLDYELIKENSKILCGYSDITALANAIYAKTGVITYSGPHFSSFGMRKGFEYTLEYFKKMLMDSEDVIIEDSAEWSDDHWFSNQENRTFIKNNGREIIKNGAAEGTIIGGNLCTLNLLQGTEYMPDDNDIILFIEDDDLVGNAFLKEFDRNFQSLLHCFKNRNIKGIVFGRAQKDCEMTTEKWSTLLKAKKEISDIPIIINVNFGHTTPIFTFPIGGNAQINNGRIIIKNNK